MSDMMCLRQLLFVAAVLLLSFRDGCTGGGSSIAISKRVPLAPTPAVETSAMRRVRMQPIFVGGLGDSLDTTASNGLNSLVPEEYTDDYASLTSQYATVVNSNSDAAPVMQEVSLSMRSQYLDRLVDDIRDEREDYKLALDYMLSLPDGDPLTVEVILEIHKILCRSDAKALPGLFRNGTFGFGQKMARYVFLQHGQVPGAMNKFVDQVNNELLPTNNIGLWGKLAWLHYRFVYIHPFSDGNGRMSSILVNWLLLKVHKSPLPVNLYESQQITQLKYLSLNYVDARLLSKLYLQRIVHNYKQLLITYRATLVSRGYSDTEIGALEVQEDDYGEMDESYDYAEFLGTANNFIHTASNLPAFVRYMYTGGNYGGGGGGGGGGYYTPVYTPVPSYIPTDMPSDIPTYSPR